MTETSSRLAAILVAATLILLAAPGAWAKDTRFMPSPEGGGRWLYLYQTGTREITVRPALAYGGTIEKIFDFAWSRNVSFGVSYLHSRSHGETHDLDSDDVEVFNLNVDTFSANIGYFFTGRRIQPYISVGAGAAIMKYEPESATGKIWEQDPYLNIGGGADFSLWETEGGATLDRVLLGARLRYEYFSVQEIVDTGLVAITATARLVFSF
ncbi:hypothetical protein K8I61_05850 [bacterium]|nr:hypothetical protein [bacterium]